MKHRVLVIAFAVQAFCVAHCFAQNKFFSKWEARVRETSAKQPSWVVPVITPSSVLVQLARTDFVRQYTSTHFTTWNYDNGKGINLIPFGGTELDINLPPYIQHNNPKVADGAGDFSIVGKVRPFCGNEKHGNYSTSFQLAVTVPTGSYKNGAAAATFAPTVIGGKGFGRFDIQSSIGATIPGHLTQTIGRTIVWNTVAQYKIRKMFWPEVELNSSFYHLGPNDGRNQTFVTPGLMVGKMKFRRDPKDRLALVFGGGMQIATSKFHSYNHGMVLTTRVTF